MEPEDSYSVGGDALTIGQQELYGVDWDTFSEPAVVDSYLADANITEETSAWTEAAEAPPPERMNTVLVEAPGCPLTPEQSSALLGYLHPLIDLTDMPSQAQCWIYALSFVRQILTFF